MRIYRGMGGVGQGRQAETWPAWDGGGEIWEQKMGTEKMAGAQAAILDYELEATCGK